MSGRLISCKMPCVWRLRQEKEQAREDEDLPAGRPEATVYRTATEGQPWTDGRSVGRRARICMQLTLSHSRWLLSLWSGHTIVLQCSYREASGPEVKKILQLHRISKVIAQLISSPAHPCSWISVWISIYLVQFLWLGFSSLVIDLIMKRRLMICLDCCWFCSLETDQGSRSECWETPQEGDLQDEGDHKHRMILVHTTCLMKCRYMDSFYFIILHVSVCNLFHHWYRMDFGKSVYARGVVRYYHQS
jgi:hypothetical protein